MTQDDRWLAKYNEVMSFMAENHKRPSKFVDEERGLRDWWKQNMKLLNAGKLKADRVALFEQLLETGERYRRVNQFD